MALKTAQRVACKVAVRRADARAAINCQRERELWEVALYQASRNVDGRSAGIERINIEAVFRGKRSGGFRATIEDA
jgi:hypothetical protein